MPSKSKFNKWYTFKIILIFTYDFDTGNRIKSEDIADVIYSHYLNSDLSMIGVQTLPPNVKVICCFSLFYLTMF